jgi:hypothetical protein
MLNITNITLYDSVSDQTIVVPNTEQDLNTFMLEHNADTYYEVRAALLAMKLNLNRANPNKLEYSTY